MRKSSCFFRKAFAIIVFTPIALISAAQQQVIGPAQKILALGNFEINKPALKTAAAPTVSQTKTLLHGNTVTFSSTDSTGRLYDPGGAAGNYLPAQTAYAVVSYYTHIGYEIVIEDADLAAGDSLIIVEKPAFGTPFTRVLIAMGNGNNSTGTFTFMVNSSSSYLEIKFSSDGGAAVGRGFSLLFRKLFEGIATPLIDFRSQSFFFDVSKGAVRSGNNPTISEGNAIGEYSSAFGLGNLSGGYASTATGSWNNAMAQYASATGVGNAVASEAGFAAGAYNAATSNYASAIGYSNSASGYSAVAAGYYNTASGSYALATGNTTNASGNISSTFGLGTQSNSYLCMSLGRYNYTPANVNASIWKTADPVLLVGNGTDAANRSNILELYKNGNLKIWGTLTQLSDEKLKKDIVPVENALQKISGISGRHYYWKNKMADQQLQTGLLAQEVRQLMPELVTESLNGELGVNYTGLIPYLVEAIKELKKEIELLKNYQRKQAITGITVF